MWSWISYMNPHRLTWGFAYNLPFAQIVAVTLLVALLFSKEKKSVPVDGLLIIWVIFLVWISITTFFAIQSEAAWEYYQHVSKDIVYIHIKDAKKINGEDHYTYCGEGDGRVKEIVGDLLANGYEGGFSIEPHLAAVIHTGQQADSEEQLYQSYTEYGRRLMKIVDDVKQRG